MRIKWWKQDDPRSIIAALVAGPLVAGIWLAGCGGGGGGGMTTTPGYLLSGTVFAPNHSLSSVTKAIAAKVVTTRQNAAYGAVPNVTVTVGRVDDNGTGFAVLQQTTTDSLGGYTFTLPAGFVPASNLLVRATSGNSFLENIVTGPTVDISPETTAATELLYTTAHNQGVSLGRLRLSNITNFISQATTIADNTLPGTSVASAIAIANSAFQSKRYATTIANDLLAVLNNAAPPPTITPGGATRTPGSGTPGGGTGGGGTGGGGTGGTPRATPTAIFHPTGQPTPMGTAQATTTPRATITPGATTAPGITPTAQPTTFGPTITPSATITPGANVTPTPGVGITPTPGFGITPTPSFGTTPTPNITPITFRRAKRGR